MTLCRSFSIVVFLSVCMEYSVWIIIVSTNLSFRHARNHSRKISSFLVFYSVEEEDYSLLIDDEPEEVVRAYEEFLKSAGGK